MPGCYMRDDPLREENDMTETTPKFDIEKLNLHYGAFHALKDINMQIDEHKITAFIGPSGCGKTTCGKTVMGLYKATDGEVLFDGVDINKLNKKEKKEFTKRAQIIFQDPYSSLNPRMTVGDIIGEGIDIHKLYTGKERQEKIYELLELVGLNREHALRFPHEFSGGQRQRIGIARALAIEPEFIVCDEPISALDVSIQSQIVNLLKDLGSEDNLAYLFISHGLSVVKYISDRIGVMYLGNIVELAESQEMFDHPTHPYTEALLSAIPTTDVDSNREMIPLEGDIPSPVHPPKGCKFHTRCKYCTEICKHITPELVEMRPGHFVACHNPLGVEKDS